MAEKINILRSLLQKAIDNIDAGNSNLTDEEMDGVVETITKIAVKDVFYTKEQSCRYLNMSSATFDNYVRCGWIPKGVKEQGGVLKWNRKDLDNVSENNPIVKAFGKK